MSLRSLCRIGFSLLLTVLAVTGLAFPASASITTTTVVGPYSSGPQSAAYSPDGRYAYVTFPDTDQLIRYDNQTGTTLNTVSFSAHSSPYDVKVSPDGEHIYVTLQGVFGTDSGGLADINSSTMSVARTISLSNNTLSGRETSVPNALVLSPDGASAYVFERVNDTVSKVSLSTGTVIAKVALYNTNITGPAPQMAITPDGNKLFVTQNVTYGGPFSRLSMISTSTFTSSPTVIDPGPGILNLPSGIAIAPDGSKMYVTNTGDDYVNIFNPSTNAYLGHVLAQNPNTTSLANTLVTVSPDSSQFVVSNTSGYGQYMFFSVATNDLLNSHSINPSAATGGMTSSLFSPNGSQLLTVIYNDYGFVLYTIDPALGIKPKLAATGINAATVIIGAACLLLLGSATSLLVVIIRRLQSTRSPS